MTYEQYKESYDAIMKQQQKINNLVYNQALEDFKKELIKIYNIRYMHDIYLDDIDDIVERLSR